MTEKTKYILDCIRQMFAVIVLLAIIAFCIFSVYYCNNNYKQPAELEMYSAYYGNFATGHYYKFSSYDCNGSHYTLYDHNKNIVADFVLTGNNQFQMERLK